MDSHTIPMLATDIEQKKQVAEEHAKPTKDTPKKKLSLADAWLAQKKAQYEDITAKLRAKLQARGISEETIRRLESQDEIKSDDPSDLTKEDITNTLYLLRGLDDGSICNLGHTNCRCFENTPKTQNIVLDITKDDLEKKAAHKKRWTSLDKKDSNNAIETQNIASQSTANPKTKPNITDAVLADTGGLAKHTAKRASTKPLSMSTEEEIRTAVQEARFEGEETPRLPDPNSCPKNAEGFEQVNALATRDHELTRLDVLDNRLGPDKVGLAVTNKPGKQQSSGLNIQDPFVTELSMSVEELETAIAGLQLEWRGQQELTSSNSLPLDNALITRLSQLNGLLAKKKAEKRGIPENGIGPGVTELPATSTPTKTQPSGPGRDDYNLAQPEMTMEEIEARMSEIRSEVEAKIVWGSSSSLPKEAAAKVVVQLKEIGTEFEKLSRLAACKLGKIDVLEENVERPTELSAANPHVKKQSLESDEEEFDKLPSIMSWDELNDRLSELVIELTKEQELAAMDWISEHELSCAVERMGQIVAEQRQLFQVFVGKMLKKNVPKDVTEPGVAGGDGPVVVETGGELPGSNVKTLESMEHNESTKVDREGCKGRVGSKLVEGEAVDGVSLGTGDRSAKKSIRRRSKKKPKSKGTVGHMTLTLTQSLPHLSQAKYFSIAEPISTAFQAEQFLQPINVRLRALREETLQIEDRESRYRNFILYHTQLWQELKPLKQDEEGFQKLLQICRSDYHSQVLINDDWDTAFQTKFQSTVELLIVLGREQVAIDRFWEDSVGFKEKETCSKYVEDHKKIIRSCQLEQCLTNLQVEAIFLHPVSWYFVCRTIGPLFRYHWKKDLTKVDTITGQGIYFEYITYILQLQPLSSDWPTDNTNFIQRNCGKLGSQRDKHSNLLTLIERNPDTEQGLRAAIERLRGTEQQIESFTKEPFYQ